MKNNARSCLTIFSPVVTGGASSPLRLKHKTLNQCSFCQFLECQAPLHKRKAPLVKTIWRRFWRFSQEYVGFDRVNRIKLMFITTESHHIGETFMFDGWPPTFFLGPVVAAPFLILELPLLRSRSHTHEKLMKTMSSGAAAMFKKKGALEKKLYNFYDGSATLRLEASQLKTSCAPVLATNKTARVKGGLGCFGTSVLKREISIAALSTMSWQLIAKFAMQTLMAFHFSIFTQDFIIFQVWFKLPKLPYRNQV